MEFNGRVWRHIPPGAHPLHADFILHASGRWNRPGEYGCLYTALSRRGALAEYRRLLEREPGFEGIARELVSIQATTRPVLDLTDQAKRKDMGIRLDAIRETTPRGLERCRRIADFARARGFKAILSPSAAISDETNLNVYIDLLPARDVHLREGEHRLTISPELLSNQNLSSNDP